MDIQNHRIQALWFNQTSNLSAGTIQPRLIVLHYTTGWNGANARDYLLGKAGGHADSKVSAHLVIDRDGSAWQIAPFNRRAWHAGPSRYGTLSDLNSHAIGIEFANPGWLKPASPGRWIDGHGHVRTDQQLEEFGGVLLAPHPRVGSAPQYAWPLYPEAQLATARAIVAALIAHYPIAAILTHEEIDTRGWKTDPGPAFPLRAFQELLGEGDAPHPPRHRVAATRLNLRGHPDRTAERIDPPGALVAGTEVLELRREGEWAFVEVAPEADPAIAGVRGWVFAAYLEWVL